MEEERLGLEAFARSRGLVPQRLYWWRKKLGVADKSAPLVSAAKLEFRKQRAGPVRARMRAWLDVQRDRHPPKSPIAAAIRYADNHVQFSRDRVLPQDIALKGAAEEK